MTVVGVLAKVGCVVASKRLPRTIVTVVAPSRNLGPTRARCSDLGVLRLLTHRGAYTLENREGHHGNAAHGHGRERRLGHHSRICAPQGLPPGQSRPSGPRRKTVAHAD